MAATEKIDIAPIEAKPPRFEVLHHTQPIGLLCTSDQLVAEATVCTTHTIGEHLFPQRHSFLRGLAKHIYTCIQGVTGGTDQTSGECSLC